MDLIFSVLFWKYYGIMLSTFLAAVLIGYAIIRVVKLDIRLGKHVDWFASASIGFFLIATITACYYTGFKTVMVAVPLVLFCVLVNVRNQLKSKICFELFFSWKLFVEILIVSFLIYVFSFEILFYKTSLLSTPHADIVFHSKLSVYLPFVKVENNELEFFFSSTVKTQPYHYFEAWLTSAIDAVFKENNLYIITLSVFTNLLFLVYIGFCSVAERILERRISWYISFFCLASVFFTGVIFDFYQSIPLMNTGNVFTRNPINYSKISVIYTCIISAILLELWGYKRSSTLSLLMLPVLFISCAPGVLSGLSAYFILNYFFTDRNLRLLTSNLAKTSAIGLFIFLINFYPTSYHHENHISNVGNNLDIFAFNYLLTCVNVVGGTIVLLVCLYLPVVVIFLLIKRKIFWPAFNLFNLFTASTIVVIFSLICWAALHRMPDSVQLFSNFTICFLNIISIFTILYAAKKFNGYRRVICMTLYGLLIFLSAMHTIREVKSLETNQQIVERDKFFKEVRGIFKGINPIGVYIRSKEEYNSVFVKNSKFATPANFLLSINDRCHQISLSVFDIPLDDNSPLFSFESGLVTSSTFYRFVQNQKLGNRFVSVEQSQIDFINQYHIQYIVASPHVKIPYMILNKVIAQRIEPVTKERIMILK
jgi:hypothetical protein